MSAEIVTIACDPGSKSGISIWVGDRLASHGTVKTTAEEIENKINGLVELCARAGLRMVGRRFDQPVTFVTEAQYLKAPSRAERADKGEDASEAGRFTAAMSVATNAVVWRTLARIMRATVLEPVHAASWRSSCGIVGGKAAPAPLKQQAVDLVREALGVRVGEDESEAILIGAHIQLLRHLDVSGAVLPVGLQFMPKSKLARKAATSRTKPPRSSKRT